VTGKFHSGTYMMSS